MELQLFYGTWYLRSTFTKEEKEEFKNYLKIYFLPTWSSRLIAKGLFLALFSCRKSFPLLQCVVYAYL